MLASGSGEFPDRESSSMRPARTCSECGTPLSNDAADGFCPSCMLEGALRLSPQESQNADFEDSAALPRLGEFELLNEIARGGMGVVYRARQVSLNRIVAVKLILVGQFAEKPAIQRFKSEAASAAKLRHPHIVAIHEIGEHSGQHYFSMEYVDGPNLADFMRQQPISIRQAAQLVKKIAEAVHYAHEQGIVHRDLKPSNILIDPLLEPRITDFGLARDLQSDSDLTLTGQVLGSPNYISPEQASGQPAGPASDIYSLGAILYHLLTGRPPFAAETPTATLHQVATADPISPRVLNPSVARDLETICRKCLEKGADKRYRDAGALAEDLRRFLEHLPITAKAVSPAERAARWCRRKPALASALALMLVVAVGSPIAAFRINRERQRAEEAQKKAEANEKKATTEAAKSRHVADFMKQTLEAVGPSVALGRDTTMLREVLNRTAQRLDEGLKQEPAVEAELRHTIGQVYRAIGEYNNAEEMLREAAAIRRTVHGAESLELAESLEGLAWVLRNLGEYAQALTLLREALPIRRKLLGDEDATVAALLYHLALVCWNYPDEIDLIEALYRDALAARKKRFGQEHPDIALLLQGLGILLERQGKFHEAELVYRESLAMRRKVRGEDHGDVAESLLSVAGVVTRQNRLQEGEALYREVLAVCGNLFGREHPGMVNTLQHLGRVLVLRGEISEAESLFRQALAILKKHYGQDHPEVAEALEGLSDLFRIQARLSEAESASREAVAARRRTLEKDTPNPEWEKDIAALGHDDEDEREIEYRPNAGTKTKLPPNERALSASLRRLAVTLRSQGKWEEAKLAYLEAAQFGDPGALDGAAWCLATCPGPQVRDGHTAVTLAEKAVAASERRSAALLDTLAAACASAGKFAAAVSAQQEAIALVEDERKKKEYQGRLRLFQSKNPYAEYWRMGAWLRDQGKLTEAESWYRQELTMRRKMGNDGIDVTTAMCDLAGVLRDQGRMAEAEALARESLAIQEKELPDDWRTFWTRSLLGSILLSQKRPADAEPLLLSGYEGLEERKQKIRPTQKRCLMESVRHLVQLHESAGQPEKAAEWKQKLAAFDGVLPQQRSPSKPGD